MNSLQYYLAFAFMLLTKCLIAQDLYIFTGKITDNIGETLAFVAILPNDDVTKAVLSDIEGRFSVSSKNPITSLTFRCVGMETLRLDADFLQINAHKPLHITLKNANNVFADFTIKAGENPADRLIRRVITNRNRNNPEKLATFQCKTYNKIAFETILNDSAFAKIIEKNKIFTQKVEKIEKMYRQNIAQHAEHQLFLMETVTERNFRFPNDKFERVILNRVSGAPNAGLVALTNMVQPFSFYSDYLRIADKDYVNPISPNSPAQYFFNIQDTLYQGIDTVFLISFHPRKGKVFEGLTGVVHINSRQWAVQNIRATQSNHSASTVKIEQQYQFDTIAQQWFPEQLNFELEFPKYPSPLYGVRVIGRSYISNVHINPPLRQKDFNPEMPLVIEDSAFGQPDSAWLPYRKVSPLTPREEKTYIWVDSIGRKKNLDVMLKGMEILASDKIPIKKTGISLEIARLLSFNDFEKVRLGIGLTTASPIFYQRLKTWESGIYAGYGWRDAAWKYGGYTKIRLVRGRETTIKLSYIHDLREAGAASELDAVGLVSRKFYANRFDANDEVALTLASRIGKRIFVKLIGQHQQLKPIYTYHFVQNNSIDPTQPFRFTELSVYAKYIYNEQNPSLFGVNINEINKVPVIEIGYAQGFDNVLNGKFAYQKWIFSAHQSIMIRRLGRMTWRVEGGKVNGNMPFAKLFTLNQGSKSLLYAPNTFQTLTDTTAWLSDKFMNFYCTQSFGNIIYRTKHSAPQLTIAQNIAFGQLSRPELHEGIVFATPAKPILESGLIIDNLLNINYINAGKLTLGSALFYRWGTELRSVRDWKLLYPRFTLGFVL